jgi:hypothetical protein
MHSSKEQKHVQIIIIIITMIPIDAVASAPMHRCQEARVDHQACTAGHGLQASRCCFN